MDKLYTGILLFALIFSAFIVETQTASCCLSYMKRPIRCALLKGFAIQTIQKHCDLNAVIFRTWISDKAFCADPNMQWTQQRIRCLQEKVKNMKHSPIYGS